MNKKLIPFGYFLLFCHIIWGCMGNGSKSLKVEYQLEQVDIRVKGVGSNKDLFYFLWYNTVDVNQTYFETFYS